MHEKEIKELFEQARNADEKADGAYAEIVNLEDEISEIYNMHISPDENNEVRGELRELNHKLELARGREAKAMTEAQDAWDKWHLAEEEFWERG